MKDQLVAVLEALRLARLELECYRDPACRASAEWTIRRMDDLLNDKAVSIALDTLVPDLHGPPLVPGQTPDSQMPSEAKLRRVPQHSDTV